MENLDPERNILCLFESRRGSTMESATSSASVKRITCYQNVYRCISVLKGAQRYGIP